MSIIVNNVLFSINKLHDMKLSFSISFLFVFYGSLKTSRDYCESLEGIKWITLLPEYLRKRNPKRSLSHSLNYNTCYVIVNPYTQLFLLSPTL
jgi:hypothetical protein